MVQEGRLTDSQWIGCTEKSKAVQNDVEGLFPLDRTRIT